MNKLAVLAFALLLFFSGMSWYLAEGSLNEYLKSQVQLQGQYYSKLDTQIASVEFSPKTGIGKFTQLKLNNPTGFKAPYALAIDEATITLEPIDLSKQSHPISAFQESPEILTVVKILSINKLEVYLETKETSSNIIQIKETIKKQLAQDYPELYPEISAKLYAEQNPDLNAENYTEKHPNAGPIKPHLMAKKNRGIPKDKLLIKRLVIKELIIHKQHANKSDIQTHNNIELTNIGNTSTVNQGVIGNKMGGILLVSLLDLITQSAR